MPESVRPTGAAFAPPSRPGPKLDVAREDPATKHWKLDSVQAAGAHLMGRVTYQDMAAFWPTSTSEYAAPMNEIPKVVFSKTLEDAGWAETRIASGDLSEEIAAIKREKGNDVIAHGGATFAQALSRLGLVDEYRLNIQPAALGAGLPLFDRLPAPLHLELVEAHAYSTGAGRPGAARGVPWIRRRRLPVGPEPSTYRFCFSREQMRHFA
jgi:dihydrofolate reductase